jgi:hypothetical protein
MTMTMTKNIIASALAYADELREESTETLTARLAGHETIGVVFVLEQKLHYAESMLSFWSSLAAGWPDAERPDYDNVMAVFRSTTQKIKHDMAKAAEMPMKRFFEPSPPRTLTLHQKNA